MTYLAMIDYRIDGLPVKVGVISFTRVHPWTGPLSDCPSDLDAAGYTESVWHLLDSKGRPADWLEPKCTDEVEEQIERAIAEHFGGEA